MTARSLLVGYALVLLIHFSFWQHLPAIIAADTMWHLTPVGRILLVLIVFILVGGLSYLCTVKTRSIYRRFLGWHGHDRLRLAALAIADIIMTLAIFWLGISVAPQIFYLLYITLFDYLGSQSQNPLSVIPPSD